jgi:hypothetical protein
LAERRELPRSALRLDLPAPQRILGPLTGAGSSRKVLDEIRERAERDADPGQTIIANDF